MYRCLKSIVLTILAMPLIVVAAPPSEAVFGAYVLLVQAPDGRTVPFARVIIDTGYTCPNIVGESEQSPITMTTRSNPHGFSVLVCEAVIDFDKTLQVALSDGAIDLPTVSSNPKHIIAFGDTGCKLPKKNDKATACMRGEVAEPFASLAKAAAADSSVDLILHLGDYNYRGTPGHILLTEEKDGVLRQKKYRTYDAGDGAKKKKKCQQSDHYEFISQNADNSNFPDTWEMWRDDFFRPAGDLLTVAPWIFARGNHELCSRAGPGWFYFLDPSSELPEGGGKQLHCPQPKRTGKPIDNVVLRDSYMVNLETLNVVVMDSANACDGFAPVKAFTSHYKDQFKRVKQLTPKKGSTWFMSHRPIWGVEKFSDKESTGCTPDNRYGCINQTLQTSLQQSIGSLPGGIRLVLAGHMHRFQSLTFASNGRPPQLILGTGGVQLAGSLPIGVFQANVAEDPTQGRATGKTVIKTTPAEEGASEPLAAFGYLDVIYHADGTWKGTMVNPLHKLIMADCGSDQVVSGSVCEFAPNVEPQ